jgi:hypothetical protein
VAGEEDSLARIAASTGEKTPAGRAGRSRRKACRDPHEKTGQNSDVDKIASLTYCPAALQILQSISSA